MSGGFAAPANGLGLVGGSLSVHMDGEPERLPVFRAAIAAGRLEPGYAADDGAALLFAGERLQACVASSPSSRVVRVTPGGAEGSVVQEMPMRLLAGPTTMLAPEEESRGVSELRALRAGRHRWE
jgi:hypothetical protein